MAEVVKMPKLSDTMTDGVIAKWHKKVDEHCCRIGQHIDQKH